MTEIFTKEWVELLNTEAQNAFKDFEWNKKPPTNPLNITYRIKLADSSETFTYYLDLKPDEVQIVAGEPTDAAPKKVSFSQPQDIALGLIEGKLDSHTEFLTGKIQVEGDVLALQEYEEILKKLSQTISAVNAKLI